MTLPEFITRAVGYFDKAEPNLTASAELEAAAAKLNNLEAQIATGNATIKERDGQIANLTAERDEAKTRLAAIEAEKAVLTATIAAEKARTDDTLAALGVTPKELPASGPRGAAPGSDIVGQWEAITDPAQKIAFYRKHKTEFDAAWKARQQN